jgi:hypothetical protein
MKMGTLPDGTRGFDANRRIKPADAHAFYERGYRFAVRYVRRDPVNAFDLSHGEVLSLLGAGLGVMVVQHVASEGQWRPSLALGSQYGAVAALECRQIGLPHGVTVWCDLEGVAPGATAPDVIAYCNNWYQEVAAAGYQPGLYVGWHAGLTGEQLYRNLRFARYWSSYNLDADQHPAVRGVCMRQSSVTASDMIPGFTNQNMDVNVLCTDALGGTPSLLLP